MSLQRSEAVRDQLGPEPLIHSEATIADCRMGRYTEVGCRTRLLETTLGDYSYIAQDGEIAYATIGKFCSIASHVRLNPGNHPMWRASQSHFTYRSSRYWPGEIDDEEIFDWRRENRIRIGHDVWMGHGVVVLPGRDVGTGAVIAAGAVVTKDVEPYTIVAGVPAQPLRRRFTRKAEAALAELAWWDWDHEKLRIALPDFRSLTVDAFIEKYTESQTRPLSSD